MWKQLDDESYFANKIKDLEQKLAENEKKLKFYVSNPDYIEEIEYKLSEALEVIRDYSRLDIKVEYPELPDREPFEVNKRAREFLKKHEGKE